MLELALAGQVLIWLVVLGLFCASGQASLFHPATVYLGFHALVFVFRPILVYYLGFDSIWTYIGFQPSAAVMIETLAVTSLGLIVFVGTSFVFGHAPVVFPAEPATLFSIRQKNALVFTILLLFPLIVLSIRKSTSGDVVGEHTAGGVFIMTSSTGYLNDAQFMIAPLLCAWLLITRFNWLNVFPVMAYVGYRSWCGWSRFTIITFLLAVVVAFCWYQRRKWLPFYVIILAVPVLILFNTLGHNRGYLQDLLQGRAVSAMELDAGLSRFDKFKARADSQDFANFDYLTFLVALVPGRTHTYTYGAQYLQLFTEPIPRILWRGKPTGPPVETFNINAYGNFTGLTFSLPGDGWCSGGWVGLIITMGLVGSVLGFFHRFFWRHINDPVVAIFYCTAMAMLIQWYRDGGISIAKFMLWSWLPLLLWLGFTWLAGGASVRGWSITFRAGERLRLIHAGRSRPNLR